MKERTSLKIGHLISNFLPSVGGAQVCVHQIADRMTKDGHEAVVVTPARGSKYDRLYRYKIVRTMPLLNRLLFSNFSLGKRLLDGILRRIQERYSFDLWQATVGYPLGAAAVDFFNRNGIPCVLRCAGEDIQMLPEIGYGYRLNARVDGIVRENYKKFTAVITASESTKRECLSLGIHEDKIFIIPNGVECPGFEREIDKRKIKKELGLETDRKLIITVGRNHPKKGFEHIPQMMKRLLERGAKFSWLLIGKGCEGIKRIADKEGFGEYLIVKEISPGVSDDGKPEVPNSRLIQYYKASDIFVYPTLIELFAKAVIEAMAAGLPIVTTDALGVDDIIKENENGIKIRRGDIDGMADCILRLFDDPALAGRLAANALERSREYDWSVVTAKYLELYKRIAE